MASLCAGRAWEAVREGSKSPSCCSLQHLELCHRFHTHLDCQICMQKALPSSTKPHNSQREHPAAHQLTADTPTDETSRSEEQGGKEKRRERNKPGQR